MSKRIADKYLTDQNWDQEDAEGSDEQIGSFKKADDEVLKKRVIRKAKRRVIDTDASAPSAFSGLKSSTSNNAGSFKGFNLPAGNNNDHKQFSSFSSSGTGSHFATQQITQPSTCESKMDQNITAKPMPAFGVKSSDEEETNPNSHEYNRHLSALNKSVSEWIMNHVAKNPLCDLTPIFMDYKKYLTEIDEKFGQSDNEGSQSPFQAADSQETASSKLSQSSIWPSSNSSDKPKFSLTGFGSKTEVQSDSKMDVNTEQTKAQPNKPIFAGFQTTAPASVNTSPFRGFNVSNKPAFAGFSFSSNMVSSGGENGATLTTERKTEEEYVPPKPESSVVVEEDAFHTIACKLYYSKDNAYVNKGIGQLYLKPSGGKTQLLIRADTATGQILLNIVLHPAIPISKQGKNNVLIMCIPNPPINEKEKDKVTPMLIRVKTSDDADKLIEIIEQKKQECAVKAAER